MVDVPVMSEKLIVVVLVRGEERKWSGVASWMELACFDCKNGKSTKLSVCVVIPVYK